MKTVFSNENFVVVEKPAGWLSTPARQKDDPRPCLGLKLQEELQVQIYPVHRLDFEVSGLVMFAKNPAFHRVSQGWFEHALVRKTYYARTVKGVAAGPSEWVEWRSKLLRGKRRSYPSPVGKECVTRARVVKSESDYLVWELEPQTGRPHQLRVELSQHGYPILGDQLYGGPAIAEENRVELQAAALDFSRISAAERGGLPDEIHLK